MIDACSSRPKLGWLINSRWLVVAIKLLLLSTAILGGVVAVRITWLLAMSATSVASNVYLIRLARRGVGLRQPLLAATVGFDVLVTTLELWLTGGSANPLSAFYLVHISFAAAVLGPRWTWGLVGLAASAYGCLYTCPPAFTPSMADHATQMRLHLQGMWVAFLIAAGLIGYSVTHLQRLIENQRSEIGQALLRLERNRHLTALATLAAGAAHELATPLSTIAVVAKEMERRLGALPDSTVSAALTEDAIVLRQQVRRCRSIIDRLSQRIDDDGAGQCAVGEVVNYALSDLDRAERVRIRIPGSLSSVGLTASPRALATSLRNVIQNALDASAPGKPVTVSARKRGNRIVLEVTDQGSGMNEEVMQHATDPFFSTKRQGGGMGLGLFLTQGLMDQLGAQLALASCPGGGTTVTLTFPSVAGDA